MSMLQLMLVLMLFTFFLTTNSERILVIPYPVYSHCHAVASVGEALNKRGHTVFIYIPTIFNSGPCIDGKGLTPISYTMETEDWKNATAMGSRVDHEMISRFTKYMCKGFFQNRQKLEDLLSKKFDFGIIDPFYGSRCFLYFMNKNAIPYATVAPMYTRYENGAPFIPNTDPNMKSGYSPSMSLLQRTINTVMSLIGVVLLDLITTGGISKEFLPEVSVAEYRNLAQNRALLFIKDDSLILSGAVPVIPNTIYTGGFSAKPAKLLSNKFKSFFENSEKRVIVVSFGSVASVDDSTIIIFESVFKNLPYNILWKNEGVSKHENILRSNWIPQNDAVGHKRTILFITHCGLNGVYEGIYHAVPMLCFPLFGDHMKYAEVVQRKRFGLQLDIDTVTEDELRGAINEILSDETFRSEVEKASSLYRAIHPLPAAETAANAVEHVLKFGGEHLRPAALDLSMISFIMIDVWLVIFTSVGLTLASIIFCARCLWRRCWKRKTTKTD